MAADSSARAYHYGLMFPNRLLVISPWYPNRKDPNSGNFVRNMAELVAADTDVTVVTVCEENVARLEVTQQTEGPLRVIRAYFSGDGARVQRLWNRSKAWRASLNATGHGFDLVHAHVLLDGGAVGYTYARKRGIPFVVSEHASRFLTPSWPASRYSDLWIARFVARRAARLLPVSPALAGGMQRHGLRGRYRILSNAVGGAVFHPPNRLNDGEPFTFLHISDFSPNKRIDLLLKAFLSVNEEVAHTRLIIAGEGDVEVVRNELDSLSDRPVAAIEIFGFLPTDEVVAAMQLADRFVLTSTVETQSVVLLESLLCGTPAIATRSGGPESIITHRQRGELIDVGDQQQLQTAMLAAVRGGRPSLSQRTVIARNAREQYGSTNIRTQLLEIYNACKHA